MGSQSVRPFFRLALFVTLGLTAISFWPQFTSGPSAYAELPWRMFEYFDLTGGLNDGADQTVVKPDEASDLQNVVFTVSGAIKRRSGFTQLNSTAVPTGGIMTGLAQYTQVDGTRFLVATVANSGVITGSVYTMPYGGSTAGPTGTWTERTGSILVESTQNTLADYALAEGVIVLEDGDGTTPPATWNGSGDLSAIVGFGVVPNASMVEYHKNILWVAGDTAHPSLLSFSNIGDLTAWTETDFLNINTDDGQRIRAIKSALDCLYVFKDASIWRVCGSDRDNLIQEQMVQGYGTLSNQSVQLIQNTFYFVTQRGEIAAYDGGIHVQVISQKVTGTLQSIDISRLGQAVSTTFNDGSGADNYYIALSSSGSGTNDLLLQYHPFYKSWLKHRGMSTNALATFEIGSVQPAIMFGDYAGRANRYPNSNSDAGTAITSFYQSAQFHYPELPQEKIFRLSRVFLNEGGTGTVTFETRVNFERVTTGSLSLGGGIGSLWDTALWDTAIYGDANAVIGRVEINQIGDFFQWKLSDASVTNPYTLRGVQVWVEPTDRIGGIN